MNDYHCENFKNQLNFSRLKHRFFSPSRHDDNDCAAVYKYSYNTETIVQPFVNMKRSIA